MALSMYQASVPAFLQTIGATSAILERAEAFAADRKIDEAVLLGFRLAADMFPLARQVQLVTDFAKGTAARLAVIEIPKYDDSESTLADLRARLSKTAEFLGSLEPSRIDGSEEREITLDIGGEKLVLTGQRYLVHFAMPNFHFHATTAYDILRHCGLDIGKRDFMGVR